MKTCMLLFHDLINPNIDPRVYKEAKSLVNSGINVSIVSWAAEFSEDGQSLKNIPESEEFEGIKIRRIYQDISSNRKAFFTRVCQQFSAMLKIANEVVLEKPDVVHSHDLNTLLSGVIAKKKLNIPLIYDSHEYWPGMIAEQNGRFLAKICYYFERILLTQVDSVITVSGEIATIFEKSSCNTKVVYNSRKSGEFTKIEEDLSVENIRSSLSITTDDFIVGYIGTITPKRGLDKLIESFGYITNKNIKLLIVGGGGKELINQLKQKIKPSDEERIIFTGQIPYHDVLLYFSLIDLGCVLFQPSPNHYVAAPNKLFEYMSMGIPLLVSDFPEMRRIVCMDSKCGVCVDSTDSSKIANSISWIAENPKEAHKMGLRAQKAIYSKYSWDEMEKILFNLYEEFK